MKRVVLCLALLASSICSNINAAASNSIDGIWVVISVGKYCGVDIVGDGCYDKSEYYPSNIDIKKGLVVSLSIYNNIATPSIYFPSKKVMADPRVMSASTFHFPISVFNDGVIVKSSLMPNDNRDLVDFSVLCKLQTPSLADCKLSASQRTVVTKMSFTIKRK